MLSSRRFALSPRRRRRLRLEPETRHHDADAADTLLFHDVDYRPPHAGDV